jgi:hypothetical protein
MNDEDVVIVPEVKNARQGREEEDAIIILEIVVDGRVRYGAYRTYESRMHLWVYHDA